MSVGAKVGNIDPLTVDGFGEEWAAYDQTALSPEEHERRFYDYFDIFPFEKLPAQAEGFDLGCGSGRWARMMREKVGFLHCIDPSRKALEVAQNSMAGAQNVRFHLAGADEIPLPDESQDFGYSLGVLHHIPDTEAGMRSCAKKLKPGAPLLLYLYYNFENRPFWFRSVWKLSNLARRGISRLPFRSRKAVTSVVAGLIYLPLARTSRALEALGLPVDNIPLSAYRNDAFYTMRTDSLDRFGTRLEHRFSRAEITAMMKRCGLTDIIFSDNIPHWVALGYKAQ